MRRTLIVFCGLLLSIGLGLGAQAADLFPANVNDTWSLHQFTGESSRVQVVSEGRAGWKRFQGLFDRTLWLLPHHSRVLLWNETARATQVLYDFDAAVGDRWPIAFGTPADRLTGSVTVVTKEDKIQTAFGPRTGCMTFGFVWDGLSDAGIISQSFCPDLGLVRQDRLTFAGVDTEVTVAEAVGGLITTGYLGQGMNVRVDEGITAPGRALKVRLELWDTTGAERWFTSSTAQLFDVKLVDAAGRVVRLWSSDRMFAQIATSWALEGEKTFDLEMPLRSLDDRPLAAGQYTIEGWIIDEGPRPAAKTQVLIK